MVELDRDNLLPCEWVYAGKIWVTQCGHAFVFDSGGPIKNKFCYCPYCGGMLAEVFPFEPALEG